MFYDTRRNDHGLPRDPFKAIIVPRPIGWITSISAKGEINLAPYSFFNAVAEEPPMVMFSSGGKKDSVAFIEETKEFVCNLATYELREAVTKTGAEYPRGVNEMIEAGLAPAPSRLVRPPRSRLRPARSNAGSCRSPTCAISTAATLIVTSCSDRWWASISTIVSSRRAGSIPPRCC